MEFKNLTSQGLMKFQEAYITKLVDLQIANQGQDAIDRIKIELAKVNAELQCRGDAVAPTQATSPRLTPGDSEGQMGEDMRASLDKVPELKPGGSSTNFEASLKNCYNNNGLCPQTGHPRGDKKGSAVGVTPDDRSLNDKLEILARDYETKLEHDNLAELEQMADWLPK